MGVPWALLGITLCSCLDVSFSEDSVLVQLTKGQLAGYKDQVNGEVVYKFLNVPFAKPPTGDLRFAKPVPVDPWDGIYNATSFGPSCAQNLAGNDKRFLPNLDVSEDCLYLNIFVPRTLNISLSRSAMVWIHGGGFNVGQANMFDGSYLALAGDVIIVTTNYRVSIFGFFALDDNSDRFNGNYGLWDQQMAIQWTKDNIGAFGGNPMSITLFGESAGAMAVGLQVLAPHDTDLFQRAIHQSGVALGPTAVINRGDVVRNSRRTGLDLSCPDAAAAEGDMELVVKCLREKNMTELLTAIKTLGTPGVLSFNPPFGPVVDGDFVPQHPKEMLLETKKEPFRRFTDLDQMFGNNNAEGLILYAKIRGFKDQFKFDPEKEIPEDILCQKIGPAMAEDFLGVRSVSSAFCDRAKLNSDGTNQTRLAVELYGDLVYTAPTERTASIHSESTVARKTFQYMFSHTPEHRYIGAEAPWFRGANHADEIFYVFGLGVKGLYPEGAVPSAVDTNISETMMIYWTNFAKHGDPNGDDVPDWPEYPTHMVIAENTSSLPVTHFNDRMLFIFEDLEELVQKASSANGLHSAWVTAVLASLLLLSMFS